MTALMPNTDSHVPTLLLAESKRARFSRSVLDRGDIDTILLRLGDPADRTGTGPQEDLSDDVPVFELDESAPLEQEIARYQQWLQGIGRTPTFFCNPNEAVQHQAQAFARAAGLPHLTPTQVSRVREKPAMKELYAEAGIPAPRHRPVASEEDIVDFADQHGWPLILKPIDSDTCVGTYKLAGPADPALHHVRDDTYEWIAEEYISGTEYQLCALVSQGRVLGSYISLNPAPILDYLIGSINANITLAPSEPEPIDSRALSQQLVDALGYEHGYLHGEFFIAHDGRFVMGELAARLSGCEVPLNHGLSYGFDIMTAIADLYVGRTPSLTHTRDRSVGDLLLPTAPGVVTTVSSEDEILSMPGVISCQINVQVGEELRPNRASSACSGVVQVEGKDSLEVHERMLAVLDAYRFATVP